MSYFAPGIEMNALPIDPNIQAVASGGHLEHWSIRRDLDVTDFMDNAVRLGVNGVFGASLKKQSGDGAPLGEGRLFGYHG